MDRATFERWQLEAKQIEDLIADVERTQRAFLDSMGVPSHPVLIYAILAGEQPAPWPKRTAKRDKKRALHAMHTLVLLAKARQYVAFVEDNSRLAAHAALMAGLYANNAAEHAALAMTTRTKNSHAGKRRWAHVKRRDGEWWQAARRYRMQHPHATTREVAADVKRSLQCAKRLGVSTTTLWRMRGRHEFPEPIQISPGAIGWRESDVQAWLESRAGAVAKKAKGPTAGDTRTSLLLTAPTRHGPEHHCTTQRVRRRRGRDGAPN